MLPAAISRYRSLIDRRHFVVLSLILLWALELFVVQEATLVEHHYYAAFQPALHRVVRGSLDLLACGLMVLVLPRLLLALLFTVNLFFSGVVLAFANYSGKALSATMIFSTAGEGTSVTGAAYSMLPWWMSILVLGLAIKLYLVHRLGKVSPLSFRHRWPKALKLGAIYLTIIGITSFYKPFRLILGWESIGGIGSVYGYTPTWAAELVLLDSEEILDRAMVQAQVRSDRLDGIEASFPFDQRLVFLQVESLDYSITEFEVDGKAVTPHLNAIAERSMSYAVRSPKQTGSCDADFTALMGTMPSVDMPNYKIPGFPFEGSFVSELNTWGYHTHAVHNVGGNFFNRRPAYEEMDFDQLSFMEELVDKYGLPDDSWSTPDDDMLRWAAEDISQKQGKQFSIVITATSHIPFHYIRDDQKVFFPDSSELFHNYVDSIHYVDQAIGAYIDGLPVGTLVMIYGDHGATVKSGKFGYENRSYEGVGLVPFLIHRVGYDLSDLQRADQELSFSGELTLLDMMSYVHRVTRQHNATPR